MRSHRPPRVPVAIGTTVILGLSTLLSLGAYRFWKRLRPTSPDQSGRSDQSFWSGVGATFPSLKGAESTAYYFDCERSLFDLYLPDLAGRSLLKTDLWDE